MKKNLALVRYALSKHGDCYDNAVMESWNHNFRVEAIRGEKFKTHDDTKKQVFEYIEVYYNHKRLHSTLDFLSPELLEVKMAA